MPETSHELSIELSVAGQDDANLLLHYRAENRAGEPVYVYHRMYRQRFPDGKFWHDPDVACVRFEAGGRIQVAKWVPEIPQGLSVEYPIIPCVSRLESGQALEESFNLALPAEPWSAYDPPRRRGGGQATATYRQIAMSLGFVKASDLGTLEPRQVQTTTGPALFVPMSHEGQRVARSAPVPCTIGVAAGAAVAVRRRCANCGATNVGAHENCMICQARLPAVPAGEGTGAAGGDPAAADEGITFLDSPPPEARSTAPSQAARRCPNAACGRMVPAGLKFCTSCGARIK
jgi:hypothetical protein